MALETPLTFWSQSLENSGNDLFVRLEQGSWRELSGEEEQLEVGSMISSIRMNGFELKNNQHLRADLQLKGLGGEPAFFILDLKTIQKDSADRAAFFICHGQVKDYEDWGADVRDAILDFAREYELTLDMPPNELDFELGNIQHKKKTRRNMLVLTAAGVTVAGLVLLTIWLRG